jgi:hypothetical protein
MAERTAFRFAASGVSFELRGSEDFVRRHLGEFLPFVEQVVQRGGGAAGRAGASGPTDLTTWYGRHVPEGARLTMQDSILVFALWMRSFKKYIFTSEDIRRAFEETGQPEPKSLLQILGTLKRDHNLILGTERRGEYMLNTTGIERARSLVGVRAPGTGGRGRPS